MAPQVRTRIHLKTSIQGLTEHGQHSRDVEVPGSSLGRREPAYFFARRVRASFRPAPDGDAALPRGDRVVQHERLDARLGDTDAEAGSLVVVPYFAVAALRGRLQRLDRPLRDVETHGPCPPVSELRPTLMCFGTVFVVRPCSRMVNGHR